jgi:hypothetical protein
MYAWALEKLERENGHVLAAQKRGDDVRKVLGPALFFVRFPCIHPDVFGKIIGDLNFEFLWIL